MTPRYLTALLLLIALMTVQVLYPVVPWVIAAFVLGIWSTSKPWQDEAWRYYDDMGEL